MIGPILVGDANDYSGGIQIRRSVDSADEQGELEEDLALMNRRFPKPEGMPESRKPKSWYLDCRRMDI